MYKRLVLLMIIALPVLTGCVAAVATTAIVGTDMATDRRTSGIYIEDQSIELKVSNALADDASLKDSSSISRLFFSFR